MAEKSCRRRRMKKACTKWRTSNASSPTRLRPKSPLIINWRMNNVQLLSFAGPDELAAAAASAWVDAVESASRAGRPYCIALSGGRITQKFYLSTAEKALARKVSFQHVH